MPAPSSSISMPAPSSSGSQLWEDLPPDVIREISGRLHDAADHVHFNAVCKPWRSSHEEPTTTTRKQSSLLPWLLAPDNMNGIRSIFLEMRCVFSRTSYRARPPFSVLPRDWVASADGTAVWYYADARPGPSLRDPLTGAVARLLPPFQHWNGPWWKDYTPNGIVYDDGTVLLCTVSYFRNKTSTLRTALLRPGDATWTVAERTFGSSSFVDGSSVRYHGGKILVVVEGPAVSTPSAEDDVLTTLSRPSMPGELDQNFIVPYFLLESRGELICVSVHADPDEFGGKAGVPGLVRALSVSVHALEEDEATGKILWVRKDGGSLADRVLFLGRPNSFAVDASQLSGDAVSGGCAYFVYEDFDAMPNTPAPCYVFRYDLVHDKAKFLEQLPQRWGVDNVFTWLFPQPSIAPIQVITERLEEGRKWWKKKLHTALTPWSNIYVERSQPKRYNPHFRVFVGNLPREVDSSQLRKFFSKHGDVSNAKVMCRWKKKKRSKKIGLVTIAMEEEQADALAALNGLVFNGCILEVRLVRRSKGRMVEPPPAVSNQHTRGHLIYYIGLLILLFVIIMVLWKSSIAATRGYVPCYIPEARPREAHIEGRIQWRSQDFNFV